MLPRPTALALLLVTACAAQSSVTEDDDTTPPGQTETVVHRDVAYPPPLGGDPVVSTMDIYTVPDGAPRSLMVFVHGGSWVSGDKSNLDTTEAMIPWFLDRGFVVAAVNFRLATPPQSSGPQVSWAEQESDIAAALAFLSDNGADYGVSEPGILLLGFSSGAHLVALLAADGSFLEGVGLSTSDLSGAISFDVHAYDVPFALELMQGSVVEDNIPLIEHLFGTTEDEQLRGSPSAYVGSWDTPPSLLVSAEPRTEPGSHGDVAGRATELHGQRLAAAGFDVTVVHFDEETHSALVGNFGVDGDGPTIAVEEFVGALDR